MIVVGSDIMIVRGCNFWVLTVQLVPSIPLCVFNNLKFPWLWLVIITNSSNLEESIKVQFVLSGQFFTRITILLSCTVPLNVLDCQFKQLSRTWTMKNEKNPVSWISVVMSSSWLTYFVDLICTWHFLLRFFLVWFQREILTLQSISNGRRGTTLQFHRSVNNTQGWTPELYNTREHLERNDLSQKHWNYPHLPAIEYRVNNDTWSRKNKNT